MLSNQSITNELTRNQSSTKAGQLYLVSAGIGDAENITLKAYNILKMADVVIAMPMVSQVFEELLSDKQLLDAGHGLFTDLAKRGLNAEALMQLQQKEAVLAQQLRGFWAEGKTIVVLEMGDPCIFGPQVGYLKAFKDLKPTVIPGISSFNAANALLAQPLLAQGKRLQLSNLSLLEGMEPAKAPETWVLFCMQLNLSKVFLQLAQLYPADYPMSIVVNAGFNETQQVITGTLAELERQFADKELPWSCLLYVGVDGNA